MGASKSILVAEDSEDDAMLMRRALGKFGSELRVFFVNDGDEAIAYLSGQGKFADRVAYPMPGVVILDLKMPRLGGCEVIDWIRRESTCKSMPVIALSAAAMSEQANEVYRRGGNAFMVKPVDGPALERLLATIGAYVSRMESPTPQS